MDRDSAQLLEFLALIFVLFFAVSILFALARKPLERLINRIFPGGNFSGRVSKDLHITVGPAGSHDGSDEPDFSVNLEAGRPTDSAHPPTAELKPLEGPKRELYLESWRQTQDLFLRSPAAAVREADRLLAELIPETGKQSISLQKIEVSEGDIGSALGAMRDAVELARNAAGAARGIAHARDHTEASIEDLTLAMDHYRLIFDQLFWGEPRGRDSS